MISVSCRQRGCHAVYSRPPCVQAAISGHDALLESELVVSMNAGAADLGRYCQLTTDQRHLFVFVCRKLHAMPCPTPLCPTSSLSDYSVVKNNLPQMLVAREHCVV